MECGYQDGYPGYWYRKVEGDRFTNQMKLLTLLKSLFQVVQHDLTSVGFRSTAASSTFNIALTLLDGHFNQEESLFVKTQKFGAVNKRQVRNAGTIWFVLKVSVETLSLAVAKML